MIKTPNPQLYNDFQNTKTVEICTSINDYMSVSQRDKRFSQIFDENTFIRSISVNENCNKLSKRCSLYKVSNYNEVVYYCAYFPFFKHGDVVTRLKEK